MMPHRLRNYFDEIQPLTETEWTDIEATLDIQKFKKGHLLLREGEAAQAAYFVLAGVVRQYALSETQERTLDFFGVNQWVITIQDYSSPSLFFLECTSDCTLVVGKRAAEQELYQKHPRLESISRLVMQKVMLAQQERMVKFQLQTPEQRYQTLIQERPDLLQIAPQYQVASYIGIQPESLSRIRKRSLKGQ